jgi:hypothetical protein
MGIAVEKMSTAADTLGGSLRDPLNEFQHGRFAGYVSNVRQLLSAEAMNGRAIPCTPQRRFRPQPQRLPCGIAADAHSPDGLLARDHRRTLPSRRAVRRLLIATSAVLSLMAAPAPAWSGSTRVHRAHHHVPGRWYRLLVDVTAHYTVHYATSNPNPAPPYDPQNPRDHGSWVSATGSDDWYSHWFMRSVHAFVVHRDGAGHVYFGASLTGAVLSARHQVSNPETFYDGFSCGETEQWQGRRFSLAGYIASEAQFVILTPIVSGEPPGPVTTMGVSCTYQMPLPHHETCSQTYLQIGSQGPDTGWCFLSGYPDWVTALLSSKFNVTDDVASRLALRHPGRLGQSFNQERSVTRAITLPAGEVGLPGVGTESRQIRIYYSFDFQACPHGGLDVKHC